MNNFNYEIAFSRNLGWLSETDFQKIKSFKIAIAGMGGVGGSHLVSLLRMGFQHFVISDPDQFDLVNFNRQYGANMSTLGKSKCQIMKELALQINPEAKIQIIEGGVTQENCSEFFDSVNLYVDGLDLFALKARRLVFKTAAELGIPAVTSAPIGFGATSLVFTTSSISFDDYFDFRDGDDFKNLLKFVLGLAPSMMHIKYLADRSYSNLALEKTSSTPAGCFAASAVVCTEAVKILLNRGKVLEAPVVCHYDFYLNRFKKNRVIFGLKNPVMKIKLAVISYMISKLPKS